MALVKKLITISSNVHVKTSVEKIHVTMPRVWNMRTVFISIYSQSSRQTSSSV